MFRCFMYVVLTAIQPFATSIAQVDTVNYEFDEDSLIVEKFDYDNVDKNRFNKDNEIYTPNRRFVFNYYYEDKHGKKYYLKKGSSSKDDIYNWDFVELNKKDSNTVVQIILEVNSGLKPFIDDYPDYNQTVITYYYKLAEGELILSEQTGLVENPKNIWTHPPRTNLFRILELNPFPYIKQPIANGNNWTWRLIIGDVWGDQRWLLWSGPIEITYSYRVSANLYLKTPLGMLKSYVIDSRATSILGTTKLISYFNEVFGFVKLDYTNIDGSKLIFELQSVN